MNPIMFGEEFFGIKLLDFQKWCVMESWATPFVVWLQSRGVGKTVLSAIFLMLKMLLIPSYIVYVSTNSATQSIETFRKLEDIALQRIPSFKTVTDIFANEVERGGTSDTGFIHNPGGHYFRLFNNSSLTTLSSNTNTIRGKRGSVLFDETAWQTEEQLAVVENFINVDSNFGLGVAKIQYHDPVQMPLQLLYASSAGDISYPFYDRYRSTAKKMMLGNTNYFACDLNANTVLNATTLDGRPVKSHLTKEQVDKAFEEDKDRAMRELMNQFSKGATQNAIVKMDALIKNSSVRPPLLHNDTGKKKFIFTYDPARNYDNSILSIWQLLDDTDIGFRLRLEHVVQMVDAGTSRKTPLPMPEQLKIIKELMIAYNGHRAAEWENIELFIDAGAGGGGISAVADALMENWRDQYGQIHRGIIDPNHKQYETSRKKYVDACPVAHLLDPQSHKRIMFDALEKMIKLNLIDFPAYDNKDTLLLQDGEGNLSEYRLSPAEQLSLVQANLMKNELVYICRTETPNGAVSYDLQKDKRNTMHDDRAYCCAMAAYALALKRRTDLVTPPKRQVDLGSIAALARKPIFH